MATALLDPIEIIVQYLDEVYEEQQQAVEQLKSDLKPM